MKLPSSAIALTLTLGTILVNAPVQPVTAAHRPTEDKQSFGNRPERVPEVRVCRVQPCKYPIPFAIQQKQMSGNEPNEPLHFMNFFHTNIEPLEKEVVSRVKKINIHSVLETVKTGAQWSQAQWSQAQWSQAQWSHLSYQPKRGPSFFLHPFEGPIIVP